MGRGSGKRTVRPPVLASLWHLHAFPRLFRHRCVGPRRLCPLSTCLCMDLTATLFRPTGMRSAGRTELLDVVVAHRCPSPTAESFARRRWGGGKARQEQGWGFGWRVGWLRTARTDPTWRPCRSPTVSGKVEIGAADRFHGWGRGCRSWREL